MTEKRQERLALEIDRDLKALAFAMAKRDHSSVSRFIRELVRKEARRRGILSSSDSHQPA